MSKWVDEHKRYQEDQWYVTVDDVEELLEECNKEVDRLREQWGRCNDTVADYIKKVDELEEEIKKLREEPCGQ